MNTNNKHPHFSRTVLHNGEERVKRIFRDQLAELAGLLGSGHFAAGCGGVDAGGGAADQNAARPAGGYQ